MALGSSENDRTTLGGPPVNALNAVARAREHRPLGHPLLAKGVDEREGLWVRWRAHPASNPLLARKRAVLA